jgi:hypothetical protein
VCSSDLYETSVAGTVGSGGEIYFRIGLKSTYTPAPDYPARYAVVLLSYGNNTRYQKIYLRQGDDADYLMTNSDPVSTGGITSRTLCRKFSPYNLTADNLDKDVGVRGARFVDFPTKAGAFFQWWQHPTAFGTKPRWAWNPHLTNKITSWSPIMWTDGSFWNVLAATYEISPTGFRRPNDGPTNGLLPSGLVSGSELRQSLFSRPRIDFNYSGDESNSIYGYYADGFFDRRQITGSANTDKVVYYDTTVAVGTSDVAYIGRLFFNNNASGDHYNASLFFPYAGWRFHADGDLRLTGGEGVYLTATISDKSSVQTWLPSFLRFRTGFTDKVSPWKAEFAYGAMIRPVAE